ncbi:MAG: proteasome beta subunit [Blastocatellia bacterium]|jgi:ATP-dependent protease HslVU (ClpYQ) peptidase subunit|nr:proteasome beta subunit [Blastocatellia bacterium]
MTLIVGVKCSDGIVLGADGAATFGTMGQRTIRQSVTKLHIISHRVIVGVSGPIGLSQRITGRIENLYQENKFSGLNPVQAMTLIRETIWPDLFGELQAASIAKNVIGPVAMDSAIASSIVALPLARRPALFQFDQQGAPEEATDDLPFIAIGSGQPTADPFLAFVRKIFWPKVLPSLEMGIFSTLWTLEHAIDTNPGGVADPKQIIVLEKSGKDYQARQLADEDLQEHYEAINAAETALRDFRKGLSADVAEATEVQVPQPDIPESE